MPVLTDESMEAGRIIYDWTNAYANKRAAYFRADLTIRFRFDRKRTSHELGMELQNISDQKNVFTEYFDPASGTTKTEYQVGFFFLPTYRLYF